MANNYILPFAQSGGALVQNTADYAADAQRSIGNQPGTARADFVNKLMRQTSAIAAGVAQFLADNQATDVTDDLLAAAISTMFSNAVKAAASMPAGAVVWVPSNAVLPNTVKVNGALLSRATYARLYAFAQASGNMAANDGAWVSGQFSPGDGATTFRIPDLRGYILRAWDDGRGLDGGRAIGSVQNDQNSAHVHSGSDSGHAHTGVTNSNGDHAHNWGVNSQNGNSLGAGNWGGPGTGTAGATSTAGAHQHAFTTSNGSANITIGSSGGSEARMKNLAFMPVMFF